MADELRITRERTLDVQDARDAAGGSRGDPTELAGRVVDGGHMPTTVPAVFLCEPVEFDGGQAEGDTYTVNAIGDRFGVVFLGPAVPSVGDVYPLTYAGGRWIADQGEGTDDQVKPNCTLRCSVVGLPYEVTIAWPNVYGWIPDPFHHEAPTWGIIYPEASGTLVFNPGVSTLGGVFSPYWQGWVGSFDRVEGSTTFHWTMEWTLSCDGGGLHLFLHVHTDAVVFPTSDIYYGFGGDFDVIWSCTPTSVDPPVLPFVQSGSLLGGNVLPDPTVSAPASLGECCQVFVVTDECGLPLTFDVSVYESSGGRLLTTVTGLVGSALVSWKGTCSVYVTISAAHFLTFADSLTFAHDSTSIELAPVPGERCCQSFRVVSCFGLPIPENLILTLTDPGTGATLASQFIAGTGAIGWAGGCSVHAVISGGLAVRYLAYAADLPLTTGGTTEIVLWPAAGYVCIAGFGSPFKTTLRMTHTTFGAVTLVYDGAGVHGAGWYAHIAYAYPGRHCCPAKTVPVTCFLSIDGTYRDFWRS